MYRLTCLAYFLCVLSSCVCTRSRDDYMVCKPLKNLFSDFDTNDVAPHLLKGAVGPKGDKGDIGPTGSKGEPGEAGIPIPTESPGHGEVLQRLKTLEYNFAKLQTSNLQLLESNNRLLESFKHLNLNVECIRNISTYYQLSSRTLTWIEGRNYCRSMGADLAVKGLQNKNLRALIVGQLGLSGAAWIGMTDIEQEGHWKWLDGSTVSNSDAMWFGSEPDNDRNNEDCGSIDCFYNCRSRDYPCEYAYVALCEFPNNC